MVFIRVHYSVQFHWQNPFVTLGYLNETSRARGGVVKSNVYTRQQQLSKISRDIFTFHDCISQRGKCIMRKQLLCRRKGRKCSMNCKLSWVRVYICFDLFDVKFRVSSKLSKYTSNSHLSFEQLQKSYIDGSIFKNCICKLLKLFFWEASKQFYFIYTFIISRISWNIYYVLPIV